MARIYWFKSTNTDAFTSTKVQILTHLAEQGNEEGVYKKFMHMLVQLVKRDIETSKYVCVCVCA